jgi:glycosyltransferase involved in cell wall biosynthesis
MNILVVCQRYYPEPFSITNICENLVKKGNSVTVLTSLPSYGSNSIYPGYEKEFFEKHNGVLIYRVWSHPRNGRLPSLVMNYLSFWINSNRKIRKLQGKFDIVYSMCLSPITSVICANKYAKRHHLKHVHHCLDVWPESAVAVGAVKKHSPFYAFLYKVSKSIYSKMDVILVSSPSFSSYFASTFHFDPSKLLFVPQLPLIVAPEPITPIYRHGINFLYAGNIGFLQQVNMLIDACFHVDSREDFCLHIIGSGSKLDDVKKDLMNRNGDRRVSYDGLLTPGQASSYMAAADCLVVSLHDGDSVVSKTIPNKLITYLSYGKPIICVLGGDGAKIAQEASGCLVCKEREEDVTQTFVEFLSLSQEKRKSMGERNKAFFDRNFSEQRIMNQIVAVLQNEASSTDKKG